MSEGSYNLRPRVKVRSRSETRSALSHEPSSVTRSAVARSILTGERGPVPGQHPVAKVVGSVVAPLPGPEMWSRQVFSLIPGDMDSTPAEERVFSLDPESLDSSPAGEQVYSPESIDASSISVVRSSSDIVVTEVAAAGTSLIESGLPATVASSPSQPSQSAICKQTGEIPAVTERPSAIEEDLWRQALDLPVGLAPLPASPDVYKHGPCATMTDADRQMPARPEPSS